MNGPFDERVPGASGITPACSPCPPPRWISRVHYIAFDQPFATSRRVNPRTAWLTYPPPNIVGGARRRRAERPSIPHTRARRRSDPMCVGAPRGAQEESLSTPKPAKRETHTRLLSSRARLISPDVSAPLLSHVSLQPVPPLAAVQRAGAPRSSHDQPPKGNGVPPDG
jgi:hypothetical protein